MNTTPTSQPAKLSSEEKNAHLRTFIQWLTVAALLTFIGIGLNDGRASFAMVALSAVLFALSVGALGYAIRAASRLQLGRLTLILPILMAAYQVLWLFLVLMQLAFWDPVSSYLACTSSALTDQGAGACLEELSNGLLRSLFGPRS
ncbi:MAG: hypothetical protein Q4P36_05700 [Bowdeniella nasicola]|nr:hypothetical protein [Bowdeniella nasicola]